MFASKKNSNFEQSNDSAFKTDSPASATHPPQEGMFPSSSDPLSTLFIPLIGPYRKIYLEEQQKAKEKETEKVKEDKEKNSSPQPDWYHVAKSALNNVAKKSLNSFVKLVWPYDKVARSAWQTAKKEISIKIAGNVLMQGCIIGGTYLTSWLYRSFEEIYHGATPSVGSVVCVGALAAIGLFKCSTLLNQYFDRKIYMKVDIEFFKNNLDAVKKLKLDDLETTDYANESSIRVRNEYRYANLVLEKLVSLQSRINVLSAGIFFGCIAWRNLNAASTVWMFLALATSAIPQFIQAERYAKDVMRIGEKNATKNNKVMYLGWTITDHSLAREVKRLGAEKSFRNETIKEYQELIDDNLGTTKRNIIHSVFPTLIGKGTACACALGFFWKAWSCENALAPETLVMANTALFSLYYSISSFFDNHGIQLEHSKFVDRIMNFNAQCEEFDMQEKEKRTKSLDLSHGALPIKLKNVTYRYPNQSENARPALNEVNLTIEPGKIVVIVGPNGGGKTTLLKSIMNNYSPSQGNIFYGEQDIEEVKSEDINSNIAYAGQESVLFNYKTIKENIELGRRLDEEEDSKISCEEAIEWAQCKDFIDKKGINTKIGTESGGVMLSTGQKSMIYLARAFVRNPKIMIFDEPTANIDSPKAKNIFKTFKEKIKKDDKIVVIVTHEMKYVPDIADVIIVIKDGKVSAMGTHEEVLKSSKWYRDALIEEGAKHSQEYEDMQGEE